MYIAIDTGPYSGKVLVTEDLRCIRPNGNRIEFWEHGWWTLPDCVYCWSASDAQYLYDRLWYRYCQELNTGQKVLVNLQVQ